MLTLMSCCEVLWRGSEPCFVCGGPGRAYFRLEPAERAAVHYAAADA